MRTSAIAFILAVVSTAGLAQVRGAALGEEVFPIPTMGGKQFWADELFFQDWRIQRNVLTDHCRLLDGRDMRHASGTYVQCRVALERIKQARHLPPMKGKAVVVLHGLGRSRASMETMAGFLREQGGYQVFNVGYPSTRREVAAHADALRHIIENLDGIEEINFVAHSLGNIVVRHYLADYVRQRGDEWPISRQDRRIRRFVMLGPPNQGSTMAAALGEKDWFVAIAGPVGQQLGREWEQLMPRLATPRCEFGIIAGGRGDDTGYNPLLPGDDDGVVQVPATRLSGAHDFLLLPCLHTFLVDDPKVMQATLNFLQQGCFTTPAGRHPIP